MNTTMETIEALTKAFAGARAELAERLDLLREEQEAAKRRRLQGIKNALGRVQSTYDELKGAVEGSPALFEQPKTRVMHGIRVGWMKQRGKLEIADRDGVVERIRKVLGDEAAHYIKITEAPIVSALANVPAKDLRRIGITLTDDVDAVVIKAADGELDKLIDALVNDKDLEAVAS